MCPMDMMKNPKMMKKEALQSLIEFLDGQVGEKMRGGKEPQVVEVEIEKKPLSEEIAELKDEKQELSSENSMDDEDNLVEMMLKKLMKDKEGSK